MTASIVSSGKPYLKGAWLGHMNHLNFAGTADRLRRCQLSSPVSVKLLMVVGQLLITPAVEICSGGNDLITI